ncbi:MAG TPA: hypothetical protein VK588_12110 [Chitinophagaceae bacterium]|nr:hypothetical protein [Chitinophagaceae bacterium]
MYSKIRILFLVSISPILLVAQNKATKKFVDSSELQLKLFASEMFYSEQVGIADTAANKKLVDYFGSKYFQESNYSQAAIEIILAYSKQEAHKNFISEERGKCLCFNSSLLFFASDKLDRKVKSLRKYLGKKIP